MIFEETYCFKCNEYTIKRNSSYMESVTFPFPLARRLIWVYTDNVSFIGR